MRRRPSYSPPSYALKFFTLKNFNSFTQTSNGVLPTKKGLIEGINVISGDIALLPNTVKFYSVDNNIFAYDGEYIYQSKNGEWAKRYAYSQRPFLIGLTAFNERGALVCAERTYILYNDRQLLTTAPKGKLATVYKGMLFIADKNALHFSKVLEYETFDRAVEGGGFITTDINYGDIVGLVGSENGLIIICERAIYILKPLGERLDYTLKRIDCAVNALSDSVREVGGKAYFISDGHLVKFDGKNLKEIEININLSEFEILGQFGANSTAYYFALKSKTEHKFLICYFDTVNEIVTAISANSPLLAENGYFADGNVIMQFSQTGKNAVNVDWESVELDFGIPTKKALTKIAVRCATPIELTVTHDYGQKTFNFQAGFNQVKTNLLSKGYKLNLKGVNSGLAIDQIKFSYVIKEE